MKKIYLLLLLLGISSTSLIYGQCTPDPNLNYNGISPETLPNAMAGYPYQATLSFKIPKDSVVAGNIPVTIDSAKFLYASGRPDGFTFVCDKAGCTWLGGSKGCALFSGFVDSSLVKKDTLVYPMKIYTQTYYRFTGSPDQYSRIDSATNYVFRIFRYNGIAELTQYTTLKAFPNPTNGIINIELRDIQNEVNEVTIMDAFGKVVYVHQFDKPSSFLTTFSADLSKYSPGLYLVTLTSGSSVGLSKVVLR